MLDTDRSLLLTVVDWSSGKMLPRVDDDSCIAGVEVTLATEGDCEMVVGVEADPKVVSLSSTGIVTSSAKTAGACEDCGRRVVGSSGSLGSSDVEDVDRPLGVTVVG